MMEHLGGVYVPGSVIHEWRIDGRLELESCHGWVQVSGTVLIIVRLVVRGDAFMAVHTCGRTNRTKDQLMVSDFDVRWQAKPYIIGTSPPIRRLT